MVSRIVEFSTCPSTYTKFDGTKVPVPHAADKVDHDMSHAPGRKIGQGLMVDFVASREA